MEFELIPLERSDPDLARLKDLHHQSSIARYVRLSETAFTLLTETEGVLCFKIKSGPLLLGGLRCQLIGDTLFLTICIGEGFRRRGIASAALKALAGSLPDGIRRMEASVDAENTPSLRLFEKLCFQRCGWAEGQLTYRLDLNKN